MNELISTLSTSIIAITGAATAIHAIIYKTNVGLFSNKDKIIKLYSKYSSISNNKYVKDLFLKKIDEEVISQIIGFKITEEKYRILKSDKRTSSLTNKELNIIISLIEFSEDSFKIKSNFLTDIFLKLIFILLILLFILVFILYSLELYNNTDKVWVYSLLLTLNVFYMYYISKTNAFNRNSVLRKINRISKK